MEMEPNSIYKFSKSFEERYNEYCGILIDEDNSDLFSVREKWSMYLEIGMNCSSHGWYAFWNILRIYCDGLNITFPKVVRVRVNNVNYEKLSADVLIVDPLDDEELCSIPREIESVPLKDLYMTTSQEITGDLDVAAECLEQLRFFYHHLWWPWTDEEGETIVENESVDWASNHLEYRLKLYYDKLKMPYTLAKKITRYMEKCKESYNSLQNNDDLAPIIAQRLQNELNWMKVELNQLCIPEIRELEYTGGNIKPSLIVALEENRISNIHTYLLGAMDTLVPEKLDELPIKLVSSDLEECLLNYDVNDIILVTPGLHKLDYMEYFDFPVRIKGSQTSSSSREVIVSDARSFSSIFQFLATTVEIENIDFHLNFSRIVFNIKRGTLVLNNVHFHNFISKETTAIQLLKDTRLLARGCRFSNFNEAIVCQRGAVVELVDCTFENNCSCIQFVEGVKLTMNNCDLTGTKSAPFIYEVYSRENEMEEQSYESLDYLSRIPGVTINGVQVNDESIAVEKVVA